MATKTGAGRVTPQAKFCYGNPIFGELAWGWESVPQEVSDVVGKLCLEVSHLGDVLSKAELRWGPLPGVTHRIGDGWSVGEQQHIPQEGRLDELVRHHFSLRDATLNEKGSSSSDNLKGQKKAAAADKLRRDPRTRLRLMTYVPESLVVEPLSSPWTRGVWIPLHKGVAPENVVYRTRFLHKQLNRQADRLARSSESVDSVPGVLNGHHDDLTRRPANNVAVAYIPDPRMSGTGHAGGDRPGFLILIPEGVQGDELNLILRAACALNSVDDLAAPPAVVDPTRWWDSPAEGHLRLWATYPLAVTETLITRTTLRTAEESARQSLRYVFRDHSGGAGTVVCARQSRTAQMDRFYHRATPVGRRKLPLVSTYEAVVDLRGVLPDTAVCVIGQSRHFGVGLLIPRDVPVTFPEGADA
jgi:CRISPR-associated protein Csb2